MDIRNSAQFPNEQAEQRILKENGGKGRLVPVEPGRPGHGAFITVHGINGSPDTVAPLAAHVPKDKAVLSFAYDDAHKRLGESSDELADSLRKWSQAHPGQPLQIRAHSSGARVTVDALRKLSQQGALKEKVQLDLVAPVVAGFGLADLASIIPDALAKRLPDTAPGKDIGVHSAFQKQLEATSLPPNVTTRIFVGDKDKLIDSKNERLQRVAKNLHAQQIMMHDQDHMSILGSVGELR